MHVLILYNLSEQIFLKDFEKHDSLKKKLLNKYLLINI